MTDSEATAARNVLANLPDHPGGRIVYKLITNLAAAGVEAFPTGPYNQDLDPNGVGTQVLPVPTEGAWTWEVTLPDSNTYTATLPAGADIQLTAWLASALSSETANSLADSFVLKGGDTMTGPLDFSGTDHGGVRLISLTTVQRDALTPAVGMVIYNTTAGELQKYDGTWGALGGGGAVDSVFGLTGDVRIVDLAEDVTPSQLVDYFVTWDSSAAAHKRVALSNIGYQAASAKLTAIAALTWAANSIILLTGTATAAVQALAAHVVTFIQSASAADARTAIGAAAASDLTTHEALTTTAHGGVLPEDAGIVAVASSRDIATTDRGKLLTVTATAALNCPNGITGNLQCAIASHGGTTTITATTTLQYLDGGLQTAASGLTVNTQCTLVHFGANVWTAYGDVTPI